MAAALVARFWYLAAVGRKLAGGGRRPDLSPAGAGAGRRRGLRPARGSCSSSGGRCPPPSSHRLHPFVLALADLVGIDTPNGQRVVGACLGVLTVGLVGLLARRIAGDRAGLVAAGLAALSPVLIEHDTSLGAEGLYAAPRDGVAPRHPRRHDPPDPTRPPRAARPAPRRRRPHALRGPAAGAGRRGLVAWRPGRPSAGRVARTLALVGAGALVVTGAWAVRSSLALHSVVPPRPTPARCWPAPTATPSTAASRRGCGGWTACGRSTPATSSSTRRRATGGGPRRAGTTPPTTPWRCRAWPTVRVLRTWGLWDAEDQIGWETFEGLDRSVPSLRPPHPRGRARARRRGLRGAAPPSP